jgi:hypothetical protein
MDVTWFTDGGEGRLEFGSVAVDAGIFPTRRQPPSATATSTMATPRRVTASATCHDLASV